MVDTRCKASKGPYIQGDIVIDEAFGRRWAKLEASDLMVHHSSRFKRLTSSSGLLRFDYFRLSKLLFLFLGTWHSLAPSLFVVGNGSGVDLQGLKWQSNGVNPVFHQHSTLNHDSASHKSKYNPHFPFTSPRARRLH